MLMTVRREHIHMTNVMSKWHCKHIFICDIPILVDPKQILVALKIEKQKEKVLSSFCNFSSSHFIFNFPPSLFRFSFFSSPFPSFPSLSFPGRSAEILRWEESGDPAAPSCYATVDPPSRVKGCHFNFLPQVSQLLVTPLSPSLPMCRSWAKSYSSGVWLEPGAHGEKSGPQILIRITELILVTYRHENQFLSLIHTLCTVTLVNWGHLDIFYCSLT